MGSGSGGDLVGDEDAPARVLPLLGHEDFFDVSFLCFGYFDVGL